MLCCIFLHTYFVTCSWRPLGLAQLNFVIYLFCPRKCILHDNPLPINSICSNYFILMLALNFYLTIFHRKIKLDIYFRFFLLQIKFIEIFKMPSWNINQKCMLMMMTAIFCYAYISRCRQSLLFRQVKVFGIFLLLL